MPPPRPVQNMHEYALESNRISHPGNHWEDRHRNNSNGSNRNGNGNKKNNGTQTSARLDFALRDSSTGHHNLVLLSAPGATIASSGLAQDHRRSIGFPLDVQFHEGRAAGIVLVHDLGLWLCKGSAGCLRADTTTPET